MLQDLSPEKPKTVNLSFIWTRTKANGDTELIEKGFYYLQQASKWEVFSKYYLEACIAYWHTVKIDIPEKWPSILSLYDALMLIDDAPIIRLNRIFVVSKVYGNKQAILEAETLKLTKNHFYWILLAELHKEADGTKTIECLQQAIKLCKNDKEKQAIESTLKDLADK